MVQNQVKRIAYASVLLFYFMLLTLSVSGTNISIQRNALLKVNARTEDAVEKKESQVEKALQDVSEILSGPLGKPYQNDGYFDGSEIQVYNGENYYLIGLQGAEFYSYLLYDKQKQTLTDIGIQNEVIRWDKENDVTLWDNHVSFYCTGKKREKNALLDFPYTIFYDIEEKDFSKLQEELIPSGYGQWHESSYCIGSESSNSVWEIEKLKQEVDGFSIYFNRLEMGVTVKKDYPQMRMETEEDGKVRLWIKNCSVQPNQTKEMEVQGICGLQAESYHKGNEYGSLITFEVDPDYCLYGTIEETGYPGPMTFSLKKPTQSKEQKVVLKNQNLFHTESSEWKDGKNNFEALQDVREILNTNFELIDSIYKHYGEKIFVLNQPAYYLIGLQGYLYMTDYYLYVKDKKELLYLDNILTESVVWNSVISATLARNDDVIVFPYTGFKTFTATDFPSVVSYDIPSQSYQKEYRVLAGDQLPHTYFVGSEYNSSFWKIREIKKENNSFSLYFEILEDQLDADYYYPSIIFESNEENYISLWIKRCNIEQEMIINMKKIVGISNLSLSETVVRGETGLKITFKLSPDYFLFGKINRQGWNQVGGPLTFYVEKTKKIDQFHLDNDM